MKTNCPVKIVLIGASVRPLISSCLRAGCVPVAFDFFADWDGQQMIDESGCENASLTKIDRYENLLELDFASLGDAAILTGGAELRSELVKYVSEQIPLLGPDAESMAAISDPFNWLRVLHEAECRVPAMKIKLPLDYLTNDWLVKLRGNCGGSGVQVLDRKFQGFDVEGWVNDSYFQKRIPGQSMSVVLLSRRSTTGLANTTFSLGYTRQWLATDFADEADACDGRSWCRQTSGRCPEVPRDLANSASSKSLTSSQPLNRPFAYHGSVGPLEVSESVQLQVERIANLLAQKYAMQGVWGVDFVLDAKGQVWPVDFNPRITASAELFEAAIARSKNKVRSLMDLHLLACCSTESDEEEFKKLAADRDAFSNEENCEAKRIVFLGSKPIGIDKSKWEQLSRYYVPDFFQSNQTGVSIADVPPIGDRIEAGRPLLTIRSRAKTEAAALALLNELFAAVEDWIGNTG